MPGIQDYQVLYFRDLPVSEEFFNQLSEPGIYGIHCFATNKTFFQSSIHIGYRIDSIFDEFQSQIQMVELPRDLLLDYMKYGSESFCFIIVYHGRDLSFKKRQEFLNNLKTCWSANLYPDTPIGFSFEESEDE